MRLRASIVGRLRNTSLAKAKYLLPVFEAVMNSFQAIEDAPKRLAHVVRIDVAREATLDPSPGDPVTSFSVSDTGVGFTPENYESFSTVDSDYKFRLGGKGLGRFLWLKAFNRVEIDSHFFDAKSGSYKRRAFIFDTTDDDSGRQAIISSATAANTVVRLLGYHDPYKSECPRDLRVIAQRIIGHFLPLFLDSNGPAFILADDYEEIDLRSFFKDHVEAFASEHPFRLQDHDFSLRGFRLQSGFYDQHQIVFAAHFREVTSERLSKYIQNLRNKLVDPDQGAYSYLCLIQGPFLDAKVNTSRTDFNIPKEPPEGDTLFEDLSLKEIRDEALRVVRHDIGAELEEIDAGKKERVEDYVNSSAPEYRILLKDLPTFIDQINPAATPAELDATLHKQLYSKQLQLRDRSVEILKEAVDAADTEEYDKKFRAYIEAENELGKSALAKYITHRRVILELLERAVSVDQVKGKYPLEKAVHRLVFPMRMISDDVAVEQQNLWVIDERLSYHAFLSSDQPLNKATVLESDSASRPDILIFNKPLLFGDGVEPMPAMVVIEFKRADRSDFGENPVDQVFRMVREVREGARKDFKGRHIRPQSKDIPAYCYIICDLTAEFETDLQNRGAHRTPDNMGYYSFNPTLNAYYEVISYTKLLSDAKKRNRVLFERLNLPTTFLP